VLAGDDLNDEGVGRLITFQHWLVAVSAQHFVTVIMLSEAQRIRHGDDTDIFTRL